jgi:thiamine pyrophosphate-dependent acetolactate synthase large subunit-like protein
LGLALGLPNRRVISIDSDGGILMGLGVLATLGNENPPNLTAMIFDNEAYGTTGGQPSATAGGTDLVGMAQAAGIRNAHGARTLEEFEAAFKSADDAGGTTFIVAKVALDTKGTESAGYILGDGRENMYRFARYVERTEGKRIFQMSRAGRFDAELAEKLSFGRSQSS